MSYTALGDPEVENRVAEIADRIIGKVIRHLKPESLVLTGSFGKGEATVLKENGNLKFLSDFEIDVVSRRYLLQSALHQVEKLVADISQENGLEAGVSGVVLSLCSLFPPLFKTLRPTITNYDLKYGSRIVHGKDYLERMPDYKPQDIPLWEGIRLLFNRMSAALNFFLGNNRPTAESVFHIYKVVLACQDAILLSTGNYHPSYAVRNQMLRGIFPRRDFSELNRKLPGFLRMTVAATDFKLKGNGSQNPTALWFDVAEICDVIFRYVIKKDMGLEFSDYLEFQKKYSNNSALNSYTQARLSSPLYQNTVSLIKMFLSSRGAISWKILRKIWHPWSRMVYSVIPLAYFSLSPEGNVNQTYLKRAGEVLASFGRLKGQSGEDTPESVAEEIYRLIYYCC